MRPTWGRRKHESGTDMATMENGGIFEVETDIGAEAGPLFVRAGGDGRNCGRRMKVRQKGIATAPASSPAGLHALNPHRDRYDLGRLVAASAELGRHVRPHPVAGDTVDFTDPAAVLALNRALLRAYHGVSWWELPPGALCPPVPGRADYLCQVKELLEETDGGAAAGADALILDIGTGASCIYPILGASLFGWRFVATDAEEASVRWAERVVAENPALAERVVCRWQTDTRKIFAGVVREGERFAASVCNPPFHASREEAEAGTRRKLRNLGPKAGRKAPDGSPVLNFGGRGNELWCEGGEAGFVRRMIRESAERPGLCEWFTTLVSKSGRLPELEDELAKVGAKETRVLGMRHGEKFSRVLAWRF